MKELDSLWRITHKLRRECPWDRKQTQKSLLRYLREESRELREAVLRGKKSEIRDELGDVLHQVLFHAAIAEEKGWFGLRDVLKHLEEKLIRRHPHVFGGKKAKTIAEVLKNWKEIKLAEKNNRRY